MKKFELAKKVELKEKTELMEKIFCPLADPCS